MVDFARDVLRGGWRILKGESGVAIWSQDGAVEICRIAPGPQAGAIARLLCAAPELRDMLYAVEAATESCKQEPPMTKEQYMHVGEMCLLSAAAQEKARKKLTD